jgi:hypothetical protein
MSPFLALGFALALDLGATGGVDPKWLGGVCPAITSSSTLVGRPRCSSFPSGLRFGCGSVFTQIDSP